MPTCGAEELLRLTKALPMGILQVGAGGGTLFSNPRWFEITGLPAASRFADLVALAEPATRTSLTDMLSRCSTEGTEAELQFTLETPAGHRRVCWLRLSALTASAPHHSVLASLEDVTSTHRLHRQLVEAAERDPLTRLLNRSAIVERLERSLRRAAEDDLLVGVLFVDLDDFKAVNDRFGHATGDDLLQRVGAAITGCVRRGDLVGRFGGDEFVVIVPDLQDAASARLLAARIMAALGDVVVVRGEHLITGSVGVAAARARATSANQLLEAADTAMYEVKRRRAAC